MKELGDETKKMWSWFLALDEKEKWNTWFLKTLKHIFWLIKSYNFKLNNMFYYFFILIQLQQRMNLSSTDHFHIIQLQNNYSTE